MRQRILLCCIASSPDESSSYDSTAKSFVSWMNACMYLWENFKSSEIEILYNAVHMYNIVWPMMRISFSLLAFLTNYYKKHPIQKKKLFLPIHILSKYCRFCLYERSVHYYYLHTMSICDTAEARTRILWST